MLKCREYTWENSPDWEKLIEISETAGFFQTKKWLNIWLRNFPQKHTVLGVYNENVLVGLTPLAIDDDKIRLLGHSPVLGNELVSDYGDIIAARGMEEAIWLVILAFLKKNYSGKKLILDFIREDSPTQALLWSKFSKINQVDVAPTIDLPKSWEKYLNLLARKDRHELKRKMKRLETTPYTFYKAEKNEQNIDEFFRLIRLSSPEKKRFLSEKMAGYFRDTIQNLGKNTVSLWLMEIEEKKAAGLLTFSFENEILLYNSGFDPSFKKYSVGLLANALLIRQSIESGVEKFDFLRGNERYKYDLGGKDKKLYQLIINL